MSVKFFANIHWFELELDDCLLCGDIQDFHPQHPPGGWVEGFPGDTRRRMMPFRSPATFNVQTYIELNWTCSTVYFAGTDTLFTSQHPPGGWVEGFPGDTHWRQRHFEHRRLSGCCLLRGCLLCPGSSVRLLSAALVMVLLSLLLLLSLVKSSSSIASSSPLTSSSLSSYSSLLVSSLSSLPSSSREGETWVIYHEQTVPPNLLTISANVTLELLCSCVGTKIAGEVSVVTVAEIMIADTVDVLANPGP